MKKSMSGNLLILSIILSLFVGCGSSPTELVNAGKIHAGMSKGQMLALYMEGGNNPMFLPSDYSPWDSNNRYEILSGIKKDTFYLFLGVTQPIRKAVGLFDAEWLGNGYLHSWHPSYEEALKAAGAIVLDRQKEAERIAEMRRKAAELASLQEVQRIVVVN